MAVNGEYAGHPIEHEYAAKILLVRAHDQGGLLLFNIIIFIV